VGAFVEMMQRRITTRGDIVLNDLSKIDPVFYFYENRYLFFDRHVSIQVAK